MLIINAKLIDHSGKKDGSLRVEESIISEIGDLAPKAGEEVIDAKGAWLLSGAVDLNFHLKDPGSKRIETIGEATADATRGAITTILASPDTTPAIDNETVVEYILAKASATAGARVLIAGEVAKQDKLNNIAKLFAAGASAIGAKSSLAGNAFRRACEYALMADKALFVSCKNDSIDGAGVMHDGEVAASMGLLGIPDYSESSEALKVAEIAKSIGNKLVIEAISSQKTINALARTDKLYLQVLLPHLLLTDQECLGFNTNAKISPPLREESDRKALIGAIKNGTIAIISSGHLPQDLSSKDQPFELATSGISSARYFLPLLYTYLVKSGDLTIEELARSVSYNPAKVLNEPCGELKVGLRADLVLFDPEATQVVSSKDSVASSPWEGKTLSGKVIFALVGGKKAFSED